MPRWRMLALDIDGTLVNSRDELTASTREALLRAAEKGLRLVIATGRRYRRALPLVEPLAVDLPLVTAAGALIKRPLDHATLFRAEFPPGVVAEVVKVVDQAGFDPILYVDTYHEGYDFYIRRLEVASPELAEFYVMNAGSERVLDTLVHSPPEGVFAAFTMGTQAQMVNLHEQLQQRLPGILYTHVLRSPRYCGYMCEIAPAGIDKWSGIHRLAQEWGIADDEICAVGDDVNDIPMIRAAGMGVAMGNALPEVKAAADRIAPCHDSDGLVEVVDWLLSA